MDRDETIKRIRKALRARSGKDWSVTGGRGTAWGWITIDAPPRRRTWKYVQTKTPEPPAPGAIYRGALGVTPGRYVESGEFTSPADDPWAREALEQGRDLVFQWEVEDPAYEFGHMSPADRAELASLLGLDHVHFQGCSIAVSSDYRQEYVARAEGKTPAVFGSQYWD
jgi:hypothetical protein